MYLGHMNEPTVTGYIKGICGDDMKFYLYIEKDIIKDICFFTKTGCDDTKIAGHAVSKIAKNKHFLDALGINPKEIIQKTDMNENGYDCCILAVSTLHKAIAQYLLTP